MLSPYKIIKFLCEQESMAARERIDSSWHVAYLPSAVVRCDMSCGGRSASFDMSQGYSLLPSFSCPPPPPSLNELYLVPKET